MNQNVKKFLSVMLLAGMVLMMCSCGKEKKAFEASKLAYDNINSAYQTVEVISEDIYTAWQASVYKGYKQD